jgi:mannose-6-phosphate isomerase-like protein (cupin superfamily)
LLGVLRFINPNGKKNRTYHNRLQQMNIKDYIATGILDVYVLGIATKEESDEVKQLASAYPEIKKEIEKISSALEMHAQQSKITPHPAIKPLLIATIDYMERLEKGEEPVFPPTLNENSKLEDYREWVNRKDMFAPLDFEEIHVKIIGFSPEVTSAIVWIKNMAPEEVHDTEYEKFLIIEGTCDITIGEKVHQLIAGDYLSIPLHVDHHIKVTSSVPCKVILQRIAA